VDDRPFTVHFQGKEITVRLESLRTILAARQFARKAIKGLNWIGSENIPAITIDLKGLLKLRVKPKSLLWRLFMK
jgi:hypothetical protein